MAILNNQMVSGCYLQGRLIHPLASCHTGNEVGHLPLLIWFGSFQRETFWQIWESRGKSAMYWFTMDVLINIGIELGLPSGKLSKITMERSTIFHGKTHYKWAIYPLVILT